MSKKTNTFNAYESELVGALLIGATTVVVTSTVGLQAPLYLVVDPDDANKREWIRIDTINVNTLENITRGLEGSAGAPSVGVDHDSGAKIRAIFAMQHLEDLFFDSDANEVAIASHADDPADPHVAAGYLKLSVADSRYLLKNGDVMAGTLDMNGQRLIGVPTPVDSGDAVNKQFVDDLPAGFSGDHGDLTNVSASQHHTRYSDNDAQLAMDTKADLNPFNHDKYTDVNAVSAMGVVDDANDLNHVKTPAFADAPSDGQLYGRRDGAWVAIGVDFYSKVALDTELQQYYTRNTDARAFAGRRIYIEAADPGAIANGDIWHDLP